MKASVHAIKYYIGPEIQDNIVTRNGTNSWGSCYTVVGKAKLWAPYGCALVLIQLPIFASLLETELNFRLCLGSEPKNVNVISDIHVKYFSLYIPGNS